MRAIEGTTARRGVSREPGGSEMFGDGFEQSTILRTGPGGLTRVITRSSWAERESVLVQAREVEASRVPEVAAVPRKGAWVHALVGVVCVLSPKRRAAPTANPPGPRR
jgi:hypothetical protein